MFRHLRTRLIVINLIATTIVLAVAFTSIYLIVGSASERRPFDQPLTTIIPPNDDACQTTIYYMQTVSSQIRAERHHTSTSLLITLIASGVMVEIAVAILSYFLAEAAIKPVRKAYETQRIFIANASHEIKTPLAAISANLEAADITDNEWIDNVSREVKKLTELNQQLLLLVRADSETALKQPSEPVALAKFLREQLKSVMPRLEQKGINVKLNLPSANVKASLPKSDFAQIINILLDNAIKYCQHEIEITLTERNFVIQNDGATIPEADLPHIFDRFYQTDKSAEGIGLGLAIAESVAERHHWKLTAASDTKITTFTLEY